MSILCKRLAGWWLVLLFSIAGSAAVAESDLRLIDAARTQNWKELRALLKERAVDVNVTQPDGTTALAWTVYWDEVEVVKLLLDYGADPDVANEHGVTPLTISIKNRSPVMVEALLERKADPNTTLWNGETPLLAAARTGSVEIATLLLDHGADVNAREPRRKQTALMWAISFGYPDIAQLLIESGADIEARSKMLDDDDFTPMVLDGYMENVVVTPQGGYAPLMFAARMDDLATARLLLDHGADINIYSQDGSFPLGIAAAEGYEELAMYFLEQGADPNLSDGNGMTALHYAMRDGLKVLHGYGYSDVIRVCGFSDEEARCKPMELMTDMDMAMLNDPFLGLKIVEPKAMDPSEPLPGRNMYELAEALLERGAHPNVEMKYPPPRLRLIPMENSLFNTKGATPFFLAVAALDLKAVGILLEHGADPLIGTKADEQQLNHQTKVDTNFNQILGNATPLMVSVGMGRTSDFSVAEEESALEIAGKLLSMGANVNAASVTGWTPLHAAAFIGANKLIKFLVENGAMLDVTNGCGMTPLDLAKGETALGLLVPAMPRESTTDLLLNLGASSTTPSDPVGQCVLGRAGLDIETEFQKRVRSIQRQLLD